mmetsp:Transcript_45171/g.116847  ORF Transcript_45171/g.116847 Transcript_45171/m.116847 type:complete len:352 (-) Transcript_45171:2284-3339(-)
MQSCLHAVIPVEGVETVILTEYFEQVCNANGKAIICKASLLAMLGFEQLVLRPEHVVNKVNTKGRYDDEEVLQMSVLICAQLLCKHLHEKLEVVGALSKLGGQVGEDVVQIACSLDCGLRHRLCFNPLSFLLLSFRLLSVSFRWLSLSKFSSALFKMEDVGQIRYELHCFRAEIEATTSDHPHIAKGVTHFCDENAELIQIGEVAIHNSKLSDIFVELFCPLHRVLVIQLFSILFVKANVFDQPRLDVIVVKELRENYEFSRQVLIGEVDSCSHNASTVRADRIGNVPNTDRVQEFLIVGLLDKNLIVQIVVVSRHKNVNVTHNFEHVQALLECLAGQMCFGQLQSVLLLC